MSLLAHLMTWRTKRANPRSTPADLVYEAVQPIAKAVDDHAVRIADLERGLFALKEQSGPAGDA